MKKRTYLAVVAERALARGAPLDRVLTTAMKAGAAPSARVSAAITTAGTNRLPQTLDLLSIDSLVSAVARVEPSATAHVGQRLRRLPTLGDLFAEHVAPAVWPVFVSFFAINMVLVVTSLYVFPVLEKMYKEHGQALPGPTQFVADMARELPGAGTFFVVCVLLFLFRKRLIQVRLRELRTARLCVATEALLRYGQRPEEFLPRLFASEGASKRLQQQFGNLPLEAKSLEHLSESLIEDARHRVIRWGQMFRIAGYVVNFTLAIGLAAAMYLAIAEIPFSVKL